MLNVRLSWRQFFTDYPKKRFSVCFHKSNIKAVLLLLLVSISSSIVKAQHFVFAQAKTENIQLYFDGAEIKQKAKVRLPKGNCELVLFNIANHLDENTIQVKSTSSVKVLSSQFTKQYIKGIEKEYVSEIARPIVDSITLIEEAIRHNNLRKNSVAKSIELLDKNQQLTLTNTTELAKLVVFYEKTRFEFASQLSALEKKNKDLQHKLNALKFRLGSNALLNDDDKGKIILQIFNPKEEEVPFVISYVARLASWQPFYEVQVASISQPSSLNFNASIVQNTGIDWTNVDLSLSNSYINTHAQAPDLKTWNISFFEPQNETASPLQRSAYHLSSTDATLMPVKEELRLENKTLEDLVVVNEKQLRLTFDIDIPYTILSNNKKHNVALKSFSVPTHYTYYVAPKLDNTVYLIGKVDNYGTYDLLSAQANVLFENSYVGKTYINPENTNQKLKLTLGKEQRISVERKLVTEYSENKTFSLKKVQSYAYEITIRNNKTKEVSVEVEDQYPISIDKNIKVTLNSAKNAEVNSDEGKLTWKLQLKPNETKKIRFGYEIELPKDKTIHL